jgi:hypothetical protein
MPERDAYRIDHVLLMCRTLDGAMEEFRKLTGIDAQIGGAHPEHGTRNALVSAGQSYIELIARSDGRTGSNALEAIDFAIGCDDIAAAAARAEAAGLTVAWQNGERRTPAGEVLRWQSFVLQGHDFGGFLPFFIDWGETPHPSFTSPGGVSDLHLSIRHPRADALAPLHTALGLSLPVTSASTAELRLDLVTPDGPVSITGDGRGWVAALAGST